MTKRYFPSAVSGRNISIFKFFGIRFFSVLLLLLLASGESWGQTTSTWTGSSAGAWLTAGNWSPSGAPNSSTSIASFGGSNTSTTVGLNTNSQSSTSLAAITFLTGTSTANLAIGNSGTSGSGGTITFSGTTINSINNVIIRSTSAYNLTYQDNIGSGSKSLGLVLGNATENIINIDGTGGIIISSIISGSSKNLTKSGSGTGVLTLSGANTYSGSTTISAGTLTLSGSGSIANSPIITIGSGATFNVSGLTTALALGTGQTLKASGTGSNTTGTITVASGKGITLSSGGLAFTAYGGGATAPLTVNGASSGALALNSAPVTVTTTTALTAGTYTLIGQAGSATGVSGTPGTLTVNGSGVISGASSSLSVSSGQLILTVTAPSTDATLSTLNISAGTLSPTFTSGTISYTASVDNATSSITVTPTRNQANATIQAQVNNGGYSSVTSGSASGSLALNVGDNTVNVKVTAQDGTTIQTYTITVNRAAASAVANPAAFAAATTSASQINLAATANGNSNNIVVVSNGTGTFTTPTDGVAAGNAGDSFAGGTVVYNGTVASLTNHTGLTANTLYYYKAFSYDGSNNFSGGMTSSATTAKIEPTNQASSPQISTGVTTSSIPLIWTAALAGTQAPDGYLVKLSTGTVSDPIDGTDPGAGSTAISSGAASYKGTTGATFTGAVAGTMYSIKIYSYTNSGTLIDFNTTSPTTFNVATLPNGVSAATLTPTGATTATISWTAASGYDNTNHSTLVFVKPTSSITAGTPTSAPSTYTADNAFGNGTAYQNDASAKCVYKGDGTSVSVTGLNANTTYYILIYTVVDASNSSSTNSYSTASTTNGVTNNLSAPNANSASNISLTGFTANWDVVGGASSYRFDLATTNNFSLATTIAAESFENAIPLFSATGGTYYNGTTGAGDSPASTSYAILGSYSYGIASGTSTLISNDINTSNSTGTQLSFRLASYSINTSGNGADASDIVTVYISPDGGTNYYSTARVLGNSNAVWTFSGGTGNALTAYDGNTSPVDFQPTGGGSRTTDGYSTVTVTGLPASANLKVKITLTNDNANERWLIDDLKITGNTSTIISGYNDLSVSGTSQSVANLSANTTYYYRVRATSTNSTSANSNTITVLTAPAAPVAAAASNVTATTFTANWAASVGGATSYALDVASDNGFTSMVSGYNNLSVSGTSQTVSGLNSNTAYYYRVRATNGTASDNSGTITATTTNTIPVSTSTNASTLPVCPTCDLTVAAGNTLTIDADKTFNTITVAPTAKLSLADGKTLTSSVTLQSSASGTATFVDNNTGNAPAITGTVEQWLTSGRNWYVSIPVSSANSSALSTATSVVYYDEPTASWPAPTAATLNPLRGYISTATTGTGAISFSGTLNTGAQSIKITRTPDVVKTGFNLIGNPYPSYVNAMAALNANDSVEKTIWYRTKNIASSYVFDAVNTTTGVGTNNNQSAAVTGYVPPMQAYWVRVAVGFPSAVLHFDNSMRLHATGSTTPLKAPAATNAVQSILRLQVSNGVNSDEAIVLFNPNASNGYDAYDSPKMSNANAAIPEIYTLAGSEQLVINGLNSSAINAELPLGFTTGQTNTFAIKASELSNFEAGTQVILKDNQLTTEYNLTDGSAYSFTADAGSTASRFSLVFKAPSVTTGLDAGIGENISILNNANNQISISCPAALNNEFTVSVYNAIGQKLESKKLTSTATVLSNKLVPGAYLVSIQATGYTATKKIIIR